MTTEDARKLFVAGLPDSMSEESLRQHFDAIGVTIVEVSLPRDRATGRARGFGFVTLATPAEAERARASLDGMLQEGRPISVRPFRAGAARREPRSEVPASSSGEDRTLYIGNLPYDATAPEIESLLADVGIEPVLRVHLPIGPDGRPRGFGFVTLSSAEAVQDAVTSLQDADLKGRRVMVKVAHPRGSPPPTSRPMPPRSSPNNLEPPGFMPEPQRVHRAPQPSTDFEEDESGEGAQASAGRRPRGVGSERRPKTGKQAPTKRRGEKPTDDRRARGGAASWQRWEDWDED